MVSIIRNEDVEFCLRELLAEEGFDLSPERSYGETGVDILATKNDEAWHIEVIGYKSSGPARAKDFYQSFFRAISRLNGGADHIVIAMPNRAKTGLPARARIHRVGWERIAHAFPELEIWLIDIESRRYVRTGWLDWLQ